MRVIIVEKISNNDKKTLSLSSERFKEIILKNLQEFKNKRYFRYSKRLKVFFDIDDAEKVIRNKNRFGYGNIKIFIPIKKK